jgi:hypothetical protein
MPPESQTLAPRTMPRLPTLTPKDREEVRGRPADQRPN